MQKLRTLIVDDDATCRRVVEKILTPFAECECLADGRTAVDTVRDELTAGRTYDLICLDVRMPELGGMEALGQIRRLEKDHRIPRENRSKVFITTTNYESISVLMQIDSWDAFLVKPIQKSELLERLAAVGLVEEPIAVG